MVRSRSNRDIARRNAFLSTLKETECILCGKPFSNGHMPTLIPKCGHCQFGHQCLRNWVDSSEKVRNRCPFCGGLLFPDESMPNISEKSARATVQEAILRMASRRQESQNDAENTGGLDCMFPIGNALLGQTEWAYDVEVNPPPPLDNVPQFRQQEQLQDQLQQNQSYQTYAPFSYAYVDPGLGVPPPPPRPQLAQLANLEPMPLSFPGLPGDLDLMTYLTTPHGYLIPTPPTGAYGEYPYEYPVALQPDVNDPLDPGLYLLARQVVDARHASRPTFLLGEHGDVEFVRRSLGGM